MLFSIINKELLLSLSIQQLEWSVSTKYEERNSPGFDSFCAQSASKQGNGKSFSSGKMCSNSALTGKQTKPNIWKS